MTDGARIKRVCDAVRIMSGGDGFAVHLDGRQARTATGCVLSAPTQDLARAVADEWRAQGEFIDRRTMPMTMILSAALDGGDGAAANWREEILKYLGTDLLCYRAESPQALAERQEAVWDPYLDWLRLEFGAALVVTKEVAAVAQPDAAVTAVQRMLEGETPHALFALQAAAGIAGSAVLALALWKRAFAPEEIFTASRVDEHFQEEQWGVDLEAKAREEVMRREFFALAEFMALLEE